MLTRSVRAVAMSARSHPLTETLSSLVMLLVFSKQILGLPESMDVWGTFYFGVHVILVVIYVMCQFIPTKKVRWVGILHDRLEGPDHVWFLRLYGRRLCVRMCRRALNRARLRGMPRNGGQSVTETVSRRGRRASWW